MLFVILTLLCVVASLSQAVELVGAEYRPAHFNGKILARNESVTVVITSSLDILAPSLTAPSSEAYHESIDTISASITTTSINDASVVVESSGDTPDSSTSDILWTLFNLGTITTVRRPTLSLPTSSPVRIQPGATSDASVITLLPPTTSSFVFNTTSRPWGWNTTSSASSLSSPTTFTTFIPPSETSSSSVAITTTTTSECPARDDGRIVVTSYSIIHTSTTTWSGDPADYTPPYPSISIPVPCTPKETPTGRFTITLCDSSGQSCTFIHTTAPQTSTANGLVPVTPIETVTFTTTDKNPAVVFPTETPPSYGGSPADPPSHNTAGAGDDSVVTEVSTPDYGMLTSNVDSAKSSPTPSPTPPPPAGGSNQAGGAAGGSNQAGGAPITVIAQPGEVVIDDHTFTDNPAQQTSTVVVGTETFTIEPSRVVGAGVTITRPPSGVGAVAAPVSNPNPTPITAAPITTTVGGMEVVYGPSVATIDGTVFTIETTPTVAVVGGQTITLGPTGIVFPSQTLHAAAGSGSGSGPTQTAVLGGELITAIGTDKVVIEGTTITYGHGDSSGSGSSTITTVIDGDTILIAPTGVIVHGTVLAGAAAAAGPSATKYVVVGGATVTQMGLTAVEISGKTFHIGLGASTAVTTVIGGHTLTIGPAGVGMSTWTLGAPFAYATTTTIVPGVGSGGGGGNNNAAMTIPTATGSRSPDKENGVSVLRCGWFSRVAIGAGCLGPLLFWL